MPSITDRLINKGMQVAPNVMEQLRGAGPPTPFVGLPGALTQDAGSIWQAIQQRFPALQALPSPASPPPVLSMIMSALGRGPAMATPAFNPNTIFYKGVERQGDMHWVIDPETGYPFEVAGAPQTVRQEDMLPEVTDYSPENPEAVTTVEKTTPPPLPTRKPKRKVKAADIPEWDTIITGLGGTAR